MKPRTACTLARAQHTESTGCTCKVERCLPQACSMVSLLGKELQRGWVLHVRPRRGRLKTETEMLHAPRDGERWQGSPRAWEIPPVTNNTPFPYQPELRSCAESDIGGKYFHINKTSFSTPRRLIHREAPKTDLDFCLFLASSFSLGDPNAFHCIQSSESQGDRNQDAGNSLFPPLNKFKSHCLDYISTTKRNELLIHKK